MKKWSIDEIERVAAAMPAKVRRRMNEEAIAEGKAEHSAFRDAYRAGRCFRCGTSLSEKGAAEVCLHWLLRPPTVTKKDIERTLLTCGCFPTQLFLRWIANEESFAGNINDLEAEQDPAKVMETTIRYRNLEWSFSCAASDLEGHAGSQHNAQPHYHFQMTIDGQPLICFGDFHCYFTDRDLFKLEIRRSKSKKVLHAFPEAEGMNDLMQPDRAEEVLRRTNPHDKTGNPTVQIDSFVVAEPGQSIKAEEINALLRESRERGVSFASLLGKLGDKVRVTTVIQPAPQVPQMAHRKPSRKKRQQRRA